MQMLAVTSNPRQSKRKRKTYGMAVRGESLVTYHGNRAPRNHPRPRLAYPDRQESWLISLPEELQSDELLRAIACRAPANPTSRHPSS